MIKKLIFVAACLLSAVNLQAQQTYPSWIQYIPPAGSAFSGGTITNPILGPDGTCGAPTYAFSSDADGTGLGLYRFAVNQMSFCSNGVEKIRYTGDLTYFLSNSSAILFGSSADTRVERRGTGTLVVSMGAATFSAATNSIPVSGVFCISTTAVATTGTSDEVLGTCTIPANALNANTKGLRIKAWGITAANGNSKTFRVRFGGIGGDILSDRTSSISAQVFGTEIILIRTGASAQIAYSEMGSGVDNGTMTIEQDRKTATQDTTAAISIVFTAHTTAAAGDFTLTGFLVEFFN